jgi:NAD(P)-dependent dehydrogenase (short-subunit alcohol dehydrogenase family)
MPEQGSVVVIGGTSGIGREVARHYVDRRRSVTISGRDAERARDIASELGGGATGVSLDLAEPGSILPALAGLGPVDHLVIAAVDRKQNSPRDFKVDSALSLVTIKMVGYLEVVHALLPQMSDDSSIVLFGGLAMLRPSPGSTMVSTVNGGIEAMVRTLAVDLAPIRVNAVHPGIVGDSPMWVNAAAEVRDAITARTPIGRLVRMSEVVDGTRFLLENGAVNGFNLYLDGGWLLS